MKDEEVQATIEMVDGQMVLKDPAAVAAIIAISKKNCRATYKMQEERIDQLVARMAEINIDPDQGIVVVINVDSWMGRPIADTLMPDHDWDQYRKQGLTPFSRGIARREGLQQMLDILDEGEAKKMRTMKGPIIWVQDHDVVALFEHPLKDE